MHGNLCFDSVRKLSLPNFILVKNLLNGKRNMLFVLVPNRFCSRLLGAKRSYRRNYYASHVFVRLTSSTHSTDTAIMLELSYSRL